MAIHRNSALEDQIFQLSETPEDFEQVALNVFAFQVANNSLYKTFCELQGVKEVHRVEDIPFLPISFFKSTKVIVDGLSTEVVFKSSGTTGQVRSEHHVAFKEVYERAFRLAYRQLIGEPTNQVIVALLPNYVAQGDSSLVYMVNELIAATQHPASGFYLEELYSLPERIQRLKNEGKEIVLFGVSYALMDLAALGPDLAGVTVVETGGMKGRRKELLKEELHAELCRGLNGPKMSSEYGMTEMLSQAYCNDELLFSSPNWLRIKIREINDPRSYVPTGKTGGVNIIDLANLYSCAFIATDDLGVAHGNQFKILGRFDNSDIRGCNLLVN